MKFVKKCQKFIFTPCLLLALFNYYQTNAMLLPFLGEEDSSDQDDNEASVKPQPKQQPQAQPAPTQVTSPQPEQKDTDVDVYKFFKNKTATPLNRLTMMGSITTENGANKVPEFKICYDGKYTYSNKEGFFFINIDEKKLNKYKLLICKNFNQDFKTINTIDHLNIFKDKNYKYYSFKRTSATGGRWVQKEKNLIKKNFTIPQHCIVVLIDPKYVASVENWQIALPSSIVKLPKIILKDSPKLAKESHKSLLYSLDSNIFHEKALEQKKAIPAARVEVHMVP